ncbi:MAG: hypothetical protein WEF86_03535 [Gemmatimonadota bacterium]
MTVDALERIFAALNAAGVRYLVVGGVAVNAHGYQRLTQDLDLVLGLRRANVLAALGALESLGYRPLLPVEAAAFADPAIRGGWVRQRNLQVFSLVRENAADVTVDIFATEPFDFETEYDAALLAELAPGLPVRFLRLDALIAMKEQAGRPRDVDDAEHLKQIRQELDDGE